MTVNTATYVPDFKITINGRTFIHGTTVDIMSVSITETTNRSDSFTISVREHNPEPGRFASSTLTWLDAEVFDEGSKIKIELGYQNNRAVKLHGYITGMSAEFPESGAPYLTVTGQSYYQQLHRQTSRKPFDAKTDGGIARAIAADLKLKTDIEEIDLEHPLVSPEGATYAAILQDRAQRLYYEVAVKEDTLVFRRPTYLSDTSAALTLTWGENLKKFTPTVSTCNLPSSVEARNTQTGQGGGKEALAATVQAGQIQCRLGTTSGLEIARKSFGESRLLHEDQRITSQAEAKLLPQAFMESRAIEYITGRGTTIGNPQLVSRKVVHLKGLGSRFSGKYYVTSTTHTIDDRGYRTEFSVKRDGR